MIIEDTQANVAVALAAFEKLMTEDNVEFIANVQLPQTISAAFMGNTMFVSTVAGLFSYDITDPAAPNCTPEYKLGNLTGRLVCLPDGAVPNHGGCSPVLDEMGEPLGDEACASGICGAFTHMKLLELGACGECRADSDCDPGQQCTAPQVDFETGVLLGATCR